jgi:TRAP-type C4-dicarboxylate transport system permease small subunit
MTMVIVVFGGMALCDKLGGHISVDIFEKVFPTRVLWIGDVIAPLLGAVIFFCIAWTVWESAALSRMLNLATNIIYLPKAWFQYVVVVMSIVTALSDDGAARDRNRRISGKPISHELR